MPEVELQLNDKSMYGEKGRIETISGVVDRNTGTAVSYTHLDVYKRQVLQGIFRRKSYGFLETQRIIVGADTQLRPYTEYFKSVLINLFRLQNRDY